MEYLLVCAQEYAEKFEEEGFDDTAFLAGLKEVGISLTSVLCGNFKHNLKVR